MDTRPQVAAGNNPYAVAGFRIERRLQSGSLASIDLATDLRRHAPTPDAVMKRTLGPVVGQALRETLLEEEAGLLARFQHPHIVAARDAGVDAGHNFLVLEYIEGADLRALLAREASPPSLRVLSAVFSDALRALAHVHAARADDGPLGLVHQAPHAGHLLVGVDGRARLIDFTHAVGRTLSSHELKTSRLLPAHTAPEQLLRPPVVDRRTDLFVLGTALWEALTGRSLFVAEDDDTTRRKVMMCKVPAPSRVRPGLPATFDALCLRALQLDPQQRFTSATEMLASMLVASNSIGGAATRHEVGAWVHEASSAFERTELQHTHVPPSARLVFTPAAASERPPPAVVDHAPHVSTGPTTAAVDHEPPVLPGPARGAVPWPQPPVAAPSHERSRASATPVYDSAQRFRWMRPGAAVLAIFVCGEVSLEGSMAWPASPLLEPVALASAMSRPSVSAPASRAASADSEQAPGSHEGGSAPSPVVSALAAQPRRPLAKSAAPRVVARPAPRELRASAASDRPAASPTAAPVVEKRTVLTTKPEDVEGPAPESIPTNPY